MPDQERAYRYQDAVLWVPIGVDRYGKSIMGLPSPIKVRWLHQRTRMLDPKGEALTVDETAIVGQDIPYDSLMWLGSLSDWFGTGSGTGSVVTNTLCVVKAFSKISDVKNRAITRQAGLMRYKGTVSYG